MHTYSVEVARTKLSVQLHNVKILMAVLQFHLCMHIMPLQFLYHHEISILFSITCLYVHSYIFCIKVALYVQSYVHMSLLLLNFLPYSPASSAPVNVTAHNLSSTSIMVTWQPPLTPNGIIRSYHVEVFASSTGDVVNEITTTNTSVIITMLEKFTTYEVQVFATTITEGDGSDVVTVTTDEDSELLAYTHKPLYQLF